MESSLIKKIVPFLWYFILNGIPLMLAESKFPPSHSFTQPLIPSQREEFHRHVKYFLSHQMKFIYPPWKKKINPTFPVRADIVYKVEQKAAISFQRVKIK